MVKHLDIQKFSCLHHCTSHSHIIRRRSVVRTRMVMTNNNGRSQSLDSRTEYFPDAHLRGTHRPLVNLHDIQNLVAPVQQYDTQVFLLEERHVILNQGGGIRGGVDPWPFLDGTMQAQTKIEGCLDPDGDRLVDAFNFCQLGGMDLVQPVDIVVEVGQHSLCELDLPGA